MSQRGSPCINQDKGYPLYVKNKRLCKRRERKESIRKKSATYPTGIEFQKFLMYCNKLRKSEAALVPSIPEPFKTNQHLLEWQERGAYNWQPPKTGKLPPLKGSMPTCPAYEFSFLLTKRF
tara:strand:+ start:238 stop:600 length:363 start_codon:yes stop_codon:yes gene_type:complete